jgi:DNA-binding CsgD family transcriptional regulator
VSSGELGADPGEDWVWRAAVAVGQIGLGPYDLPEAARRALEVIDRVLPGSGSILTQRNPVAVTDHVLASSTSAVVEPSATYPLHALDGRLTGHLHVWDVDGWPGRSPRLPPGEATDHLLAVLGGFVDWMHGPLWVTTGRPDGESTAIVANSGAVLRIPGRDPGPHLRPGAPLVRTIMAERPPANVVSRLWWVDPSGGRHRVVLQGGPEGTLVTTRQPPLPYQLTAREMEVVTLVAAGLTNAQIGRQLFISDSTVAKHVERGMRKTGSVSRAVLAVRAAMEGLTLRPLPGPPSAAPAASRRAR